MPGNFPSLANSRKQIRQRPKSRMKARLRPQRKQRFTFRVLNFGVFNARTLVDVFAINKKFSFYSDSTLIVRRNNLNSGLSLSMSRFYSLMPKP